MDVFIALIVLVASILNLILFFKVWGICNNVSKIYKILYNEQVKKIAEKKGNSTNHFSEGDLVVSKVSGKQMRIFKVLENGKYECCSNGGMHNDGIFEEFEIEKFIYGA